MRIEITAHSNSDLGFNFIIKSEGRNESVLIRQFCRIGYNGQPKRLFLHSYGGNISEGVESMCFGWRLEQDFAEKKWWRF